MKISTIISAASCLALAGAAYAGGTWAETGDAGELPGTVQSTVGAGALSSITGRLAGDTEADLFAIRITDVASFTASTVGVTTWDTTLFLFNPDGSGVALNDDHVGGLTLQSTLTGALVPSAGIYYLAIAQFDYDPQSGGADMWQDNPFRSERAPDGPGAAGFVDGWSDPFPGATAGAYKIALTGAAYAVPAPGAAALLGLGGLAGLRRRR